MRRNTRESSIWKKQFQVNSTDVSSDSTAIKKGQAFTATGYAIVTQSDQLGQHVHVSEFYFKDSKNASVWVATVPTESPVFEFDDYQKTVSKFKSAQNTFNVGDIVTFGTYEQDNATSKKELIERIVLDTDGTKLLLLSRYCLDSVPFNSKHEDAKWADSSLQKWLNTTFLNTAFTEKAQVILIPTVNETNDNPTYRTSVGNDTMDLVFLLSVEEAETYFADNSARRTEATAYAKVQGSQVYDNDVWWRLRSPANSIAVLHLYMQATKLLMPVIWFQIPAVQSVLQSGLIWQVKLHSMRILCDTKTGYAFPMMEFHHGGLLYPSGHIYIHHTASHLIMYPPSAITICTMPLIIIICRFTF